MTTQDETGLRAAIMREARKAFGAHNTQVLSTLAVVLDAALAANPAPAGLDVNALRAALRVWFGGGDFGISDIPDEIAEKYAEYARLSEGTERE